MTTRLRNVPRGLVLENDDTQSRVNSDYGEKVRSDRDARFSGPEASRHRRCLADCITNTRESEFYGMARPLSAGPVDYRF